MTSLPYDIVEHIIDALAAEGDLTPIKNVSLTSSSLLHLCRRHIFHAIPSYRRFTSLKKPFISLLVNNPAIAQYIRVLDYAVHPKDDQLSPLLPSLLQTISHLEYLRITSAIFESHEKFDWAEMDPLLQSALLHLMHLPTLTHFVIMKARNIPISALAPCINLEQLDMRYITVAQLGSCTQTSRPRTPRILHLRIDSSQTALGRLLRARWNDGGQVLDFTHVKTLVLDFDTFQDRELTQELFENVNDLEELKINAQNHNDSLAGLSEMISVNARNLKTLQLMTVLTGGENHIPMIGLCEELEALAKNNVLQILKFTFSMDGCGSKAVVETAFGRLEEVLMNQGWSTLMRVSIEMTVACCHGVAGKLGLKSVPEMYLGRLSSRKILDYKCPDFDSTSRK